MYRNTATVLAINHTTSVLAIQTSTHTTKQWHKSESVWVRVSTNCTAFFLAYTTSLLATEIGRVRVVY